MGIDAIRYEVRVKGFDTWLNKMNLKLEKYGTTPYKSSNLSSKVNSGKFHYVGVVHFNTSGNQSLVNTLVVTMSNDLAKEYDYKMYHVAIAGTHQPHKDNINADTYNFINALTKKYPIYDIDLAIDFEAMHTMDKDIICDTLKYKRSEVRENYGTYYFRSSMGKSDVCIYNKSKKVYAKEADNTKMGNYKTGLHWLRLEIPMRLPKIPRTQAMENKPIGYNKMYFKILNDLLERKDIEPIIKQLRKKQTYMIDRAFYDAQVSRILDKSSKLPSYI